jgi:hypothetical protein
LTQSCFFSLAAGIAAILRFPVEIDANDDPESVDDDEEELNQVGFLYFQTRFILIFLSATCRSLRCCIYDVIL